MKVSLVPAQVTTVEDKLASGLTVLQLVLLVIPLFSGVAIYTVSPPSFRLVSYKVIFDGIIALVFGLSAVRVREELLFNWAVTILRYNLRPNQYVFDKNDSYLRKLIIEPNVGNAQQERRSERQQSMSAIRLGLKVNNTARLGRFLNGSGANTVIRPTKGGAVNVVFTELD